MGSSCVIFFELSLELNKPYILTAHPRGCFARWKKKAGMTNVDHLSRRIFSFFQERRWRRRCFDSDSCEPEKKPTQQPNLFSSFFFLVYGEERGRRLSIYFFYSSKFC